MSYDRGRPKVEKWSSARAGGGGEDVGTQSSSAFGPPIGSDASVDAERFFSSRRGAEKAAPAPAAGSSGLRRAQAAAAVRPVDGEVRCPVVVDAENTLWKSLSHLRGRWSRDTGERWERLRAEADRAKRIIVVSQNLPGVVVIRGLSASGAPKPPNFSALLSAYTY